jgi:hypothetical protein
MSEWLHQVRVYLTDEATRAVREGRDDPALRPLRAVASRHGATLVSQLDAFEAYVEEAERDGPEGSPLSRWTKATLADPEKRAQHARAFSVRIGGAEVYAREAADALAAELEPLVGTAGVERMSRHDTNPATNMRVPPEHA